MQNNISMAQMVVKYIILWFSSGNLAAIKFDLYKLDPVVCGSSGTTR